MAQLPITSFFTFNGAPYVGEKDAGGTNVVPSLVYTKNAGGGFVPASATDPMPTTLAGSTVAVKATNGATLDDWRNNTEGVLLVSTARTATAVTPNQTNYNAECVVLTLDVTANPAGAETLELQLRYVDPASGKNLEIIANLVIPAATNGTYRLIVGLGASSAPISTKAKAYALPVTRTWMVNVFHSGVGSWTYSLGYQYNVG